MEDLNELIARARTGDRDAMAQLYRAFAPGLLGFLQTQVRRREDAEDLLGETFLSAMRDLPRFEGDAGGFRGWIYRIATNRAIDYARRQIRRPEESLFGVEATPSDLDPAAEAITRSEHARLWRAVRDLPDEQRRVIALRLSGGLTAPEIAEVIGKRVGAVKALQHRALANLSRALGAEAYPVTAALRLDERS